MKKVALWSLALCVFSEPLWAGSLLFDSRIDYNSTTYNDDAGLPNFSKFYLKTGRLDYQGQVKEDLTYRARIAFNKNPQPSARDSTGAAVEYAYIQQKFSDMFALSIGKNNTEIGGFEQETSGADIYLASESYNHTGPGGDLLGQNLATGDVYYMTGLKGIFTFGDQKLFAVITNPESDHTNGTDFDQNYNLYNLTWLGNFVDKTLAVRVNYGQLAGPSEDDMNTFIGAGLQLNSQPMLITFDYLLTEFKEGASSDKDRLQSIILKLAYTGWEQWVPRLEFSSSEEKREIGASETNKFLGLGGVVEYVPFKDSVFRYHAAVTTYTEEPETGGDKTKTEIVVGTRLLADFLK